MVIVGEDVKKRNLFTLLRIDINTPLGKQYEVPSKYKYMIQFKKETK